MLVSVESLKQPLRVAIPPSLFLPSPVIASKRNIALFPN
jgi:hypothetical protein